LPASSKAPAAPMQWPMKLFVLLMRVFRAVDGELFVVLRSVTYCFSNPRRGAGSLPGRPPERRPGAIRSTSPSPITEIRSWPIPGGAGSGRQRGACADRARSAVGDSRTGAELRCYGPRPGQRPDADSDGEQSPPGTAFNSGNPRRGANFTWTPAERRPGAIRSTSPSPITEIRSWPILSRSRSRSSTGRRR
jgi:hypothetical protein